MVASLWFGFVQEVNSVSLPNLALLNFAMPNLAAEPLTKSEAAGLVKVVADSAGLVNVVGMLFSDYSEILGQDATVRPVVFLRNVLL